MFHATPSSQQQHQQHHGYNSSRNDSLLACSVNNNNGTNISGLEPFLSNLLNVSKELWMCNGKAEDSLSLYASVVSFCKNTFVNNNATNNGNNNTNAAAVLQWGVEKLFKDAASVNTSTTTTIHSLNSNKQQQHQQPDLPDTYHEDECDVGPRPFRVPIFPETSMMMTTLMNMNPNNKYNGHSHSHLVMVYIEALLMYNKALLHHHSKSEYGEAMRLYEDVVLTISKMLPQEDLLLNYSSVAAAAAPSSNPTVCHHKLIELYMRVQNNMGQITYMLGLEDTATNHLEAALLAVNRRMMTMEQPSTAKTNSNDDVVPQQHRLDYATVISNWCRVHWMSGDIHYEKVHQGLQEVLNIRSTLLDWNHMDVASAHFNLGVAEYARNCSEAALSHLFSYLKVAAHQAKIAKDNEQQQQQQQRDCNGTLMQTNKDQQPLDPIPALIYILLVKNEHKNDEISQELVRGLRSLQEKRADVGPQGPEVASVLNFIGTLLFHQKDYEHALLFFQEELRLEENLVFHEDDVSISVTCNNIGRILQELNRLPEAKHYYHRALKAHYGEKIEEWCTSPREQNFCPLQWNEQHLQELPHSTIQLYSAVWYNLGLIHDRLGSYGQATNAFKVSLGLRRAMLGNSHADVACLLYNIGVLQMEQQMLQDAASSFREALRIRQVSPATGHLNDTHVIQTLKKLATLQKARGHIDGALETLYEILNIQKISAAAATTAAALASNATSSSSALMTDNFNLLNESDRAFKNKDVGVTLRDIAELYHAEGKLSLAVAMALESIEVFRNSQLFATGTVEFVAYTEELVAGLLLLGSLYHEHCEPMSARQLFQEASVMIRQVSSYFPSSTELDAMQEVTEILAACYCAPVA